MNLDDRKSRILYAIVRDYVQTTRPVGSERLIEAYGIGCKSATVRNEMSELSELGYIVQPHTSAGRIPTDLGYRYYVDTLMPPSTPEPEVDRLGEDLHHKPWDELDAILNQTCRILASLTSYLSIATNPITETTCLHRVYVSQATARHMLLVVVLSTGHVEHRLIEGDTLPSEAQLSQITNYLNGVVGDRELTELGRILATLETPNEMQQHTPAIGRVVAALIQVVSNSREQGKIYMEGSNQILRQPEFHDMERLELLFTALEEKRHFYEVLRHAWSEHRVTVIIGTENSYAPMQSCSLITSLYHIGGRPAGVLGVVGPTRMNYDHATVTVARMAGHLSQALTALSQA